MDSLQTNLSSQPRPDAELRLIKARCPNCFKLYAIEAAEIQSPKPQFACSKCQTHFWFPYPESLEQKEVLGFPAEWLHPGIEPAQQQNEVPESSGTAEAPASRFFNCPRCQGEYSAGDNECPKCGVVFAKLEMLEGSGHIASSPALRRQWHHVMDNYGNLEAHRKFVSMAQKENKLVFASHQYRRLLSAHSGDETALRMQKEIIALSQATEGLSPRPKPIRLSRLMPKLTTLALMGGGALIGFGLMIEAARNLIGLGAAIVFFTLAAGWLFNR